LQDGIFITNNINFGLFCMAFDLVNSMVICSFLSLSKLHQEKSGKPVSSVQKARVQI
jgi:hypothetical protein